MKWRRITILATLQAQLPATDATSVLGLTDPRLCYLLDGFLFLYAVVMTALFVKAKLRQASEPQLRPGQDDTYNKLTRGHRDDYDVLGAKRGADPELGGRHQQRRKNPQETVYSALQKDKMGEAYSEIGMKGEQRRRGKGNEGVYQVGNTSSSCSPHLSSWVNCSLWLHIQLHCQWDVMEQSFQSIFLRAVTEIQGEDHTDGTLISGCTFQIHLLPGRNHFHGPTSWRSTF
ncbi:T-cell surface glycoprotein CD3 zeta chain isoform X2 [Manacus candei]|uniref:T-cell surface glycoprotein CD3 zeta chain isoform X2 n=1 Tax=Manacus candei TaxID=415023 RepID=UPI002227AF4D|nr:T-cell surface glycoprotein CD3 zeta chain isoform X2 [Manacus candei]